MTPLTEITIDAILIGSTIAPRFTRNKTLRWACTGLAVASYLTVATVAQTSHFQMWFLAAYLAVLFVTEAARVFRGNWPIAAGLSLTFVSIHIRLFVLHQMPAVTGTILADLFAAVQAPAARPAIQRLANRISANQR